MQNTTDYHYVFEAEACDASENWDFEEMVSAKNSETSKVSGKLNGIKRLCKVEGKVVRTSGTKVIELSRNVVETSRNNAKLVDRNRGPVH